MQTTLLLLQFVVQGHLNLEIESITIHIPL